MTRRQFVQKLINVGSAVIAGTCWLAKKAAPRKFVQAIKVKHYPGKLRSLRDISTQGKWSG